jgi:hypothetical protein
MSIQALMLQEMVGTIEEATGTYVPRYAWNNRRGR